MTANESIETQKTTVDLINGDPQNLISNIKKLQLQRIKTMDDWIYGKDFVNVLIQVIKCQDILTGRLSRRYMIFSPEIMKNSLLSTELDPL